MFAWLLSNAFSFLVTEENTALKICFFLMHTSEVLLIGYYKAGAWTGWRSFSRLHPIPPSWVTETHTISAPSHTQRTNGSELHKWELSLQLLSQRWSIGFISPMFQYSVHLKWSSVFPPWVSGNGQQKNQTFQRSSQDPVVSPWGFLLAEPEAWFLETLKQRSKCNPSHVAKCSQGKERVSIYLW